MRRLVIFASCLGVGVCVDSGGGGGDGRWNSRVPVERVGGGACARQVTWHSRAPGGGALRDSGELGLLLGAGGPIPSSVSHVEGGCLIPPPTHPRDAVVANWVILTGVTSSLAGGFGGRPEGSCPVLSIPITPSDMLLVHLNIDPVLTLTSPTAHWLSTQHWLHWKYLFIILGGGRGQSELLAFSPLG